MHVDPAQFGEFIQRGLSSKSSVAAAFDSAERHLRFVVDRLIADMYHLLLSFLPVLMAIFGGTSRLEGPILGAVIFTLLREFLITEYPLVYMLIMGLTLIAVILYLPGGLIVQAIRWWIWLKIQWAKTKFQWQMLKSRWRDEWRAKVSMWLAQWRLRMQWRLGRKR